MQGRVPVLVGITDTAFVESVNLAKVSADAGADAVVLAPPYYLPEAQPELQEYLDHLVPELPLPLFLYNMPALTKVFFELETVRRAMDNPRIIGLKDSSGNMTYFHRAVEPARASARLDDPDRVRRNCSATRCSPAGTAASMAARISPRGSTWTFSTPPARAISRGRASCTRQVMRLSDSIYRVGHHSSAIIKGLKCALSLLGICDDFMAEPFHRFRDAERALLHEHLNALQLS